MWQQIKDQAVTICNRNSPCPLTVWSPSLSISHPAMMHWLLCLFTVYTDGLGQQGWQGEGSSTDDGGHGKQGIPLCWIGHKMDVTRTPATHFYSEGWWGKAYTEIITKVKHHILEKAFPKLPDKFRLPIIHSHTFHCFIRAHVTTVVNYLLL